MRGARVCKKGAAERGQEGIKEQRQQKRDGRRGALQTSWERAGKRGEGGKEDGIEDEWQGEGGWQL